MDDVIQQAQDLLAQDPLPSDAFAQLAALEARATDDEKPLFDNLWEGYYAAGGIDP